MHYPRIDLLPRALQLLEAGRGNLTPCGPGFRAAHCEETPETRLIALAQDVDPDLVFAGITAAWILGHADTPYARAAAPMLSACTPPGKYGSSVAVGMCSDTVDCTSIRLCDADVTRLTPGLPLVTTPEQTIKHLAGKRGYTVAEKTALRRLCRAYPQELSQVLDAAPDDPQSRLRRRIGEALAGLQAINVVDPVNPAHSVQDLVQVRDVADLKREPIQREPLRGSVHRC